MKVAFGSIVCVCEVKFNQSYIEGKLVFCSLGFVHLVLQNKEAVQNSAGNVAHQFSVVWLLMKQALVRVLNFPLGGRFQITQSQALQ